MKVKVKSLSPVQLSDPMDCSLPGSSVHGIFQVRVLEWGAIAFSNSVMKQLQIGTLTRYLILKDSVLELPYDPAIPLLGIHTEENRSERDTCTPMFIAALFVIARTWKQPRCPSADEWIRKLWYIYTMEYYSAVKKNSFESVLMRWMKLEAIIQSEVS